MNIYDKIFVADALGKYTYSYPYDVNFKYDSILRQNKHWQLRCILNYRKHRLNRAFQWTEENFKKLDELNTLLIEKSHQVAKEAKRQELLVLDGMKNPKGFINDYDIDITLELYADNFLGVDELSGNPFYKDNWAFGGIFNRLRMGYEDDKEDDEDETKNIFLNNGWNEFDIAELYGENHPLVGRPHGYLFHHLSTHTHLAWQDLLAIDLMYIDIKVSAQNATWLKEKPKDYNYNNFNFYAASGFDSQNLFKEFHKLSPKQKAQMQKAFSWLFRVDNEAVLIGGVAVAHYLPIERPLTPDTDFLVNDLENIIAILNEENEKLAGILKKKQVGTFRTLVTWFGEKLGIRVLDLDLDLLNSKLEDMRLHELIFETARTVSIGGCPVKIIAPEYLVLMKLAAARPKDERDAFDLLMSGAVNKFDYNAAITALQPKNEKELRSYAGLIS